MEAWHVWVIAGIALVTAEVFTAGFVVACIGLGALVTAIAAALGASLAWQLATFSVALLAVFWRLRPLLQHAFHRPALRTNASALVGRAGRVIQPVSAGTPGRVLVDGEDWRALAAGPGAYAIGEAVRVVRIDGNTLLVEA